MRTNIENAILATFLLSNDLFESMTEIYKLDVSIFTSPFRKRLATSINSVEDNNYGFLSCEIEEKIKGSLFESDYTDMISQNSLGLGFSKRYHDKLVMETEMDGLL